MHCFNFLALEVTTILSGECFHFGYDFNNFGVGDHIYTQNNLHTIWWALTSFALVMALEDVYNMDETGSFYHAQPNKT